MNYDDFRPGAGDDCSNNNDAVRLRLGSLADFDGRSGARTTLVGKRSEEN